VAPTWRGADVVILTEEPEPAPPGSFYPDDDVVVTPYAASLSWLFETVRDIAAELEGYWYFKIGLFPRMGACANALGHDVPESVYLLSVLFEAYTFLGKIVREGEALDAPPVSLGEPVGLDYHDFDFGALPDFYRARGVSTAPWDGATT
jgi:hypothetical protein